MYILLFYRTDVFGSVALLFVITLSFLLSPSSQSFQHYLTSCNKRAFVAIHSSCQQSPSLAFYSRQNEDEEVDGNGVFKMKKKDENNQEEPVWCPEQQIYVGGVVPRTSSSPELIKLLEENNGELLIFGYGSLCWNPGAGILSNKRITTQLGRAIGWKRCWSQKSADHRGTPEFNGIVCTLLSDEEYSNETNQCPKVIPESSTKEYVANGNINEDAKTTKSLTEGMVYRVPKDLVDECLKELDFREKGGYSRDVINVILDSEDDSPTKKGSTGTRSNTVICKALLYRGTPDNPAFWKRPLLDLNFASAIMATSTGPSGHNDEYLYMLDHFLSTSSKQLHLEDCDHTGDQDTRMLAIKTRQLQHDKQKEAQPEYLQTDENNELITSLYYLQGCGSNQHNQFLTRSSTFSKSNELNSSKRNRFTNGEHDTDTMKKKGYDYEDEDVRQLDEFVMAALTDKSSDTADDNQSRQSIIIRSLHAGGGHSAMVLEENGACYLWGWNDYGQLGRSVNNANLMNNEHHFPLPIIPPLHCKNELLRVDAISLGHGHTLVLERGSGYVYAFGDNSRGQVTGGEPCASDNNNTTGNSMSTPTIPQFLQGIKCSCVAAGVFHSAVITAKDGKVLIFGGTRSNNKSGTSRENSISPIVVSNPNNNTRFVKVKCGQKHLLLLDDQGQVWMLALESTLEKSNKYGQLGAASIEDGDSNDSTSDNSLDLSRHLKRVEIKHGMDEIKNGASPSASTWKCIDIDCGWSHNIILLAKEKKHNDEESIHSRRRKIYVWGRNDKGQLGLGDCVNRPTPTEVDLNFVDSSKNQVPHSIYCGSESTVIKFISEDGFIGDSVKRVPTTLYATGWNEHGNLGMEGEDVSKFCQVPNFSSRCLVNPHLIRTKEEDHKSESSFLVDTKVALGGAHMFIANCFAQQK